MTEIQLRPYQQKSVNEIEEAFKKHQAVMYVLATGGGKCLGIGTPVLMFDGSIKKVQEVVVGDQLMGPDSKPRNVLSLARGKEQMYKVTPVKGDPYIVNESHILSLRMTGNSGRRVKCADGRNYVQGEIANVSVEDYLASTNTFKHCAKGWRSSVDFEEKVYSEYLPPYFLGLWLGDGTSRFSDITSADEEVSDYVESFCNETGQRYLRAVERGNCFRACVRGLTPKQAYTRKELRRLNLLQNKHIPLQYLTGSKDQRLQLLAGLIDSDGYNNKGKGCDVVFKSERLMDDLIYLCRSLGLSAYKSPCRKTCTNTGVTGDYFRTFIAGDLSIIPTIIPRNKYPQRRQKKNVLNTGIKVEPVGIDNYYGFEIDGDHLFMLGDFTVTHNTFTFSYITKTYAASGQSVMIMAHRSELISQASLSLAKMGVSHQLISPTGQISKIKQIHLQALGQCFIDPFSSVFVGSVQTIGRRLDKLSRPDLLILDECHHAPAGMWKQVSDHFNTRHLGVTATPTRSDKRSLGEVYSEMVVGKTMKDLLRDGDLCQYRVYSTPEDFDLSQVKRIKSGESKGDYNTKDLDKQIDKPKIVGRAIEHYRKYSEGKQCLVFAVSVSHAQHIAEEFQKNGYNFVAISGKTDDAERFNLIEAFRRKEILGLVNCSLFGEGTDLVGVESVIMTRPISEAAFGFFAQVVGRALRVAEGKDIATIIDMVGNFLRHGFPEDRSDWTLWEGEEKNSRKSKDEDTVKVKTCPDCFMTHPPAPVCPGCAYVYPVAAAREYEQVEGDLVELQRELERAAEIQQRNSEITQATTRADLAAIDSKYGHKPGAAAHKQRAREEKIAAMKQLTSDIKWVKQRASGGNVAMINHLMTSVLSMSESEAMKLSAAKARNASETLDELREFMRTEYTGDISRRNHFGFIEAGCNGL